MMPRFLANMTDRSKIHDKLASSTKILRIKWNHTIRINLSVKQDEAYTKLKKISVAQGSVLGPEPH